MQLETDLAAHARSVTSQNGEDGILEEILRLLPAGNRWCVEFGAWDGKHLSNTWNLVANHGWSAVLIEADRTRHRELVARFHDNDKVIALNAFVGFDGPQSLDNLLAGTAIPEDFDLLSIDIDGNDYHVWASLARYRPRVIVIEYNPTIPNDIHFVQPRDPRVSQGSSAGAMVSLGKIQGYELAAATNCNLVFVRADLYPRLGVGDNSLARLRPWRTQETRVFQLYDGTLVVDGCDRLCWHGVALHDRIQPLPRFLRTYPGNAAPSYRVLLRAYKLYWRMRSLLRV
jgi:hypothetical protein